MIRQEGGRGPGGFSGAPACLPVGIFSFFTVSIRPPAFARLRCVGCFCRFPLFFATAHPRRPYLYMQLARFQHRVEGDPGGARTTFRAAVADIPGSRELWLAFLEFEAGQPQVSPPARPPAPGKHESSP